MSRQTKRDANQPIDAGEFSHWLQDVQASFADGGGMSVPCDECRGCCTSSYFVHVHPEDIRTFAVVSKELLSEAPGLPKGHALIGYAANGHCPLLKDRQCSIYLNRPKTCRE